MKILAPRHLAELITALQNGRAIVFPTETSYGLGCDATNQAAVDKIFKIKGRREDKPLLIVVSSVEEAKKYLVWNKALETISQKFWPGAVTVVGENLRLKNKDLRLANGVVALDDTVALRVTAHPLLKSITEKLGRPLVATSANVSGQPNCYSAEEVAKQFTGRTQQPDYVLDYGVLPANSPTTLVSVVDGKVKVLRQGNVVIM